MNTTLRLLALAGAALAAGCSAEPAERPVTIDGTATQMRLGTLSELYTAFTDIRRRPPANFEEMRAFGAALSPSQGGPINISEEFLISPRDNSPMVVRYRAPLQPDPNRVGSTPANGPVVAHEQTGVEGRRFVVYGGSNRVVEVDEAKFRELVPQ